MKNFTAKIKNFYSKYRLYHISLAVLFVLFNIMLLVNSDWPYGKNTPLNSDSYQQIGILFEHIFQVFSGKANLFYNPYIGDGIEIFSTLQYMFFNPFYLIVLCGGAKYFLHFFTISIFFMLAFNLLTFLWFSSKYFKNVSPIFRVILAFAYTFSGYVIQNISFITWMILPAILLLLVDRFLKMIKTGKIAGFIVFLVWLIVNCYSVGFSALIVLFVVFSAYIYFTNSKSERKAHFAKLFVGYFVSVLISACILFPSIVALLNTKRAGSILRNLLLYENTYILQKISILFADGIVILFSIIYLFKCNKKEGINKFFIFAFCLTLIPVIFDSSQKLLCGSVYYGFMARLYFLNEALIFILALKFLNEKSAEFEFINQIEQEEQLGNTQKSSKFPALFFWLVSAIIAIALIIYFVLDFKNIGAFNKHQGSRDEILTLINFIVFIVAVLIFVAIVILKKKNIFSHRLAKIGVVFILILSLGFNFVGFAGCSDHIDSSRKGIKNIISNNNVSDGIKFFQISSKNDLSNYVDDVQIGQAFSSLIQGQVVDFYSSLGYITSPVFINSSSSNLIMDSLTGKKYYVSDQRLDRPYLELVACEGEFYLYKNLLSTNGVIALEEKIEIDTNKNYLEYLKELKLKLGIEGDLFTKISKEDIKIEEVGEKDKKLYTFSKEMDGILYCTADFGLDDEQYSFKDKKFNSFNLHFADNDICSDICFMRANQNYSFVFSIDSEEDESELEFLFLNYDVAKEMCNALIRLSENTKFNVTKNGYEVSATLSGPAYIHVFRANIYGLNYKVNGEILTSESTVMPIFKVQSGEVTISANYKVAYSTAWIIVSLICLALILAVLVAYHFTRFRHIGGVITCAIYVVNCCILTIFYFLGILLSFIAIWL